MKMTEYVLRKFGLSGLEYNNAMESLGLAIIGKFYLRAKEDPLLWETDVWFQSVAVELGVTTNEVELLYYVLSGSPVTRDWFDYGSSPRGMWMNTDGVKAYEDAMNEYWKDNP